MHLLIKFFSKKKYLNVFLAGSLYMNTLDYFWNNGFDEQKDFFEGVVCTVPAGKLAMLPIEWRQIQASDYRFRASGYRYCNALCFAKLDFTVDGALWQTNISDSMLKFGEYIAIIKNEEEFIRRVHRAARTSGFNYLCGDVNYHALKRNGKIITPEHLTFFKSEDEKFDIDVMRKRWGSSANRDCFDKTIQYADQNEWRIALYRGVKETDAYRIEIGDISDIVSICRKYDFRDKIQQVISEHDVHEQVRFQGNIRREQLKKLFCELGNNKASLIMSL